MDTGYSVAWRRKRKRGKITKVGSWGGSKFILHEAVVSWDQHAGRLPRNQVRGGERTRTQREEAMQADRMGMEGGWEREK